MSEAGYSHEELLICTFARLLDGVGHVAVGAISPIPGSAALLAQAQTSDEGGGMRVSIIHGDANNPFTDGGRELFDCAGQGRIDAFFLGGAEIDGEANINLLGLGDYPDLDKRFPGSFGSAYVYFVIPKIILFAPEHSRRVLVDKVDFISAPGTSPPGVHRPGEQSVEGEGVVGTGGDPHLQGRAQSPAPQSGEPASRATELDGSLGMSSIDSPRECCP